MQNPYKTKHFRMVPPNSILAKIKESYVSLKPLGNVGETWFSQPAADEPKRILSRRPAGSPLVDARFHAKSLGNMCFLRGRHGRTQTHEGSTESSDGNLTFPQKPWNSLENQ